MQMRLKILDKCSELMKKSKAFAMRNLSVSRIFHDLAEVLSLHGLLVEEQATDEEQHDYIDSKYATTSDQGASFTISKRKPT